MDRWKPVSYTHLDVYKRQVEDSANFNSFLFGSIVSISRGEMLAVCIISVAVLLVLGIFSRELFYIGFDENAARISGVPVRQVNFIFTILTALTVSAASRTVGTPVSYTHLDVYKRQGSNGTVPDKRRCGYPHYTEVYRRIDHRNESGENRDQR